MATEMEDEDMIGFKLVDTVTITPSEKQKYIDLSTYGCTEFFMHGNIPKTLNNTSFIIGIGNLNNVQNRTRSDVYSAEMTAHVCVLNNVAMGFAGFETGWSNGNTSGTLIPSPRSEEKTLMLFSFYPYVDGGEQAVIEIYGR